MTDTFRYGGISFPLPATGTSLLRDADPALFFALDFLGAMIATYAGDRLIAEAAACGAAITTAVATKLPYDPGPYLLQEQILFPALCIARRKGRNDYRTVSRAHEDTTWAVTYVLPALTPAQAQSIQSVLRAVEALIANRLEQGWDATYAPPGLSAGDMVWRAAGVESIDLESSDYGGFEGVGSLYLPAVVMTLRVKERNEPESGQPLLGIDVSLTVPR